MNSDTFQINLTLAWLWIVLGFAGGFVMGLKFHRDDWLGGYGSFQRRLYRLGHISLFGLALVNLMFYFTARLFAAGSLSLAIGSWGFVIGSISMPICCLMTAHDPKRRVLFVVPVFSLMVGGLSTVWRIIR